MAIVVWFLISYLVAGLEEKSKTKQYLAALDADILS